MLFNMINQTLQNIIILNKKLNKHYISLNNLSKKITIKDNFESNFYLLLNKFIENKKIFAINMKEFNNKNIYKLLEKIIEIIEKNKYIYTNKLKLYIYNFNINNKNNVKYLFDILNNINKQNIPFDIYILKKSSHNNNNNDLIQKFYKNLANKTKFLYLYKKDIIELTFESCEYKILDLNITNELDNIVIINNIKYKKNYELSEITEYKTKTSLKNEILEKYPVISYNIKNNINKYIYISLYKNKHIQIINNILYQFLKKEEKNIYNEIMLKTIKIMQDLNLEWEYKNINNIENFEYPLNKDNIEKIKFLIFDNIKNNSNIKKLNIKKDILNKIEFFDVSKNILENIIDNLNNYNINLLNNPFIKVVKYKEYK